MFTTEKIIGDVVYISFADKERYKDIGIDTLAGHFKILGYDNIGLWSWLAGAYFDQLRREEFYTTPVTQEIWHWIPDEWPFCRDDL